MYIHVYTCMCFSYIVHIIAQRRDFTLLIDVINIDTAMAIDDVYIITFTFCNHTYLRPSFLSADSSTYASIT